MKYGNIFLKLWLIKKKIRTLENYLALNDNSEQYSRYKNVLEAIFEKIAEGVKLRGKYI